MWRRGDDVFAEVTLSKDEHDDAQRFNMHPALLDTALHALAENPSNKDGGGPRILCSGVV